MEGMFSLIQEVLLEDDKILNAKMDVVILGTNENNDSQKT